MENTIKDMSLPVKTTDSNLTKEAEGPAKAEQQAQDPGKTTSGPSLSVGMPSINSFSEQRPTAAPLPTEHSSALSARSFAGGPVYTSSNPTQDRITVATSTLLPIGSGSPQSTGSASMSRTTRSQATGPQASGNPESFEASLDKLIRELPIIGQNMATVFAGFRQSLANSAPLLPATVRPATVPAATNEQQPKSQVTSSKRSRAGEDRVLGGKIPNPNLDQSTLHAPPRRDLEGTMRIENKWGWCAANCQRKKSERLGCSALRDGTSGPECERWVHAHEICSGCPAGNYSSKKPEVKWSCEMFGYAHRFSPSERGAREQDFNNGRTGPPSGTILTSMKSEQGGALPLKKKRKGRAREQEQEREEEKEEREEGEEQEEDRAAPSADQPAAEEEHNSQVDESPDPALCSSAFCQMRHVPLVRNDEEDADVELIGTRCYNERKDKQCQNRAHDNAVCVGGYVKAPGGSLIWSCTNAGLQCRFANMEPLALRAATRFNRKARGEPDLVAEAAANLLRAADAKGDKGKGKKRVGEVLAEEQPAGKRSKTAAAPEGEDEAASSSSELSDPPGSDAGEGQLGAVDEGEGEGEGEGDDEGRGARELEIATALAGMKSGRK